MTTPSKHKGDAAEVGQVNAAVEALLWALGRTASDTTALTIEPDRLVWTGREGDMLVEATYPGVCTDLLDWPPR